MNLPSAKPKLQSRSAELILDWLYIAWKLPGVFIKKLPWMAAIFLASWVFVYFMKTSRDSFNGLLNGL